jgi:hypothetical protein
MKLAYFMMPSGVCSELADLRCGGGRGNLLFQDEVGHWRLVRIRETMHRRKVVVIEA